MGSASQYRAPDAVDDNPLAIPWPPKMPFYLRLYRLQYVWHCIELFREAGFSETPPLSFWTNPPDLSGEILPIFVLRQ